MFQRPEIKNNDAHNAGGQNSKSSNRSNPSRSYHGKLCILKNPLEMADPPSVQNQSLLESRARN